MNKQQQSLTLPLHIMILAPHQVHYVILAISFRNYLYTSKWYIKISTFWVFGWHRIYFIPLMEVVCLAHFYRLFLPLTCNPILIPSILSCNNFKVSIFIHRYNIKFCIGQLFSSLFFFLRKIFNSSFFFDDFSCLLVGSKLVSVSMATPPSFWSHPHYKSLPLTWISYFLKVMTCFLVHFSWEHIFY